MSKRKSHYHGLLIVDKPGLPSEQNPLEPEKCNAPTRQERERLPTSHDIVQMVRRWSGQRRIGHTGTLDPMASGVLVLCLGNATRLVEYYQGHVKQYYAEVRLGCTTDTYDAMGSIVQQVPVPQLAQAQIQIALDGFKGDILQVPPIYSALKRDGESLHRKARRGDSIELEPRPVTIQALTLLDFTPPDCLCLRIQCSAGTYIRSLAYDLGQALGTCGYLSALRREGVGAFTLDNAYTLAEIENATQNQGLSDLLLPLGEKIQMPRIHLDESTIRKFGYGQQVILNISPSELSSETAIDERKIFVHLEQDDTVLIGERFPDGEVLVPKHNHGSLFVQAIDPDGSFAGLLCYLGQTDSAPKRTVWKAEKWFSTP